MSEQTYVSKKKSSSFDLWQKRPPIISHLDIELTERCNNDCIHCCIRQPEDSVQAKGHELPSAEIKAILAEAAALGALSVRFTGGEPLLRDDFEEIYLSARKLGLKALLFTNATMMTPGLAELFKRVPPLKRIEVTAYGVTERSYESVTRIKGSYAKFIQGIDILVQHNIPFVVKGVSLSSTMHEIDKLEKWAGALPWMERPPTLALLFNLRDRRDSSQKNAAIEKLRISPKAYLSILNRHRAEYIKETLQFCSRYIGPPGDLLFSCSSGHTPCVDSYGNAQMCLPLRRPDTIYSLSKGSLHDALTVFFPKIRELRATNRDYLERCAICFLKGLCEQCPAKSWSEHGTLDTPVEYLCDMAHEQAKDLGLLTGREKGWHVQDWRERVAKASAKLL